MKEIWDLVGIHYLLQKNKAKLLKWLSNWYVFMDSDLDKIQTHSKTSIILYS